MHVDYPYEGVSYLPFLVLHGLIVLEKLYKWRVHKNEKTPRDTSPAKYINMVEIMERVHLVAVLALLSRISARKLTRAVDIATDILQR